MAPYLGQSTQGHRPDLATNADRLKVRIINQGPGILITPVPIALHSAIVDSSSQPVEIATAIAATSPMMAIQCSPGIDNNVLQQDPEADVGPETEPIGE